MLRILLLDAAHLEEEAAERANRHGYSKHRPALPLFTADDALAALELVEHHRFRRPFAVTEHVTALLRRAGHILGAATVELQVGAGSPVRLVYSGDLGRPDRPILQDPEPIPTGDVLVLESTYGDRVHPPDSGEALARIVREAAGRGGALLVPAFAVGRTQEFLWWLERLEAEARIPSLPIYLDSPMALDVTEIYTRHPEELDTEMVRRAGAGSHLLAGARCSLARTPDESKALNQLVAL